MPILFANKLIVELFSKKQLARKRWGKEVLAKSFLRWDFETIPQSSFSCCPVQIFLFWASRLKKEPVQKPFRFSTVTVVALLRFTRIRITFLPWHGLKQHSSPCFLSCKKVLSEVQIFFWGSEKYVGLLSCSKSPLKNESEMEGKNLLMKIINFVCFSMAI